MGRRKIATIAGAGDLSASSAESNFRELDEVFLQTQTRLWIEEVLDTRLDEDLNISNLLQDGEILYEVSKLVWDLLLTKCMELRHLKRKLGPFSSKKRSGRYRPYSNVDSFLKVCKILGLNGIDLFSPSDVVEKRDIRKVCICIRALSKKARWKQLSVPDFDMVTYSVAMPTDMVGCIRRSLESSQCTTISSSTSCSSSKSSRLKQIQKNLYAQSDRDYDSCSEGSDEAESRYMGENSCPSVDSCDTNFTPENDDSVIVDSARVKGVESNYISDYLAFSDLMVHATEDCNPDFLNGENNMFDFFLNVDSQNSEKRSFRNSKFCEDEETEVSSTTSMTSVLGRVLNLEFEDQFEADDFSTPNFHSLRLLEKESNQQCKESLVSFETPKKDTFEMPLQIGPFHSLEAQNIFVSDDIDKSIGKANQCEIISENYPQSSVEDINSVESGSQDKLEHKMDNLGEKSSDELKNESSGVSLGRKPLLKAVFRGTAVFGVLFLLLHIRKSRGNDSEGTQVYGKESKFSKSKLAPKKQQTGRRVKGVYPSEKIKF